MRWNFDKKKHFVMGSCEVLEVCDVDARGSVCCPAITQQFPTCQPEGEIDIQRRTKLDKWPGPAKTWKQKATAWTVGRLRGAKGNDQAHNCVYFVHPRGEISRCQKAGKRCFFLRQQQWPEIGELFSLRVQQKSIIKNLCVTKKPFTHRMPSLSLT